MTMSSFRDAPRQGHMNRVKSIHTCMGKIGNVHIQLQAHDPDYSALPDQKFDLWYSVYE